MQERLIELHQQRGRLLERIAAQRNTLSHQLAPLDRAFNLGDRISRLAQDGKTFVLQHPLGITAAAASVLLLKPRVVLRWTKRAILVWRTWRGVRALVPNFLLNRFLK